MKSIVLAAAATALLSTAALAQPAPSPEQHGSDQTQSTTPTPPSHMGEPGGHHMQMGPAQEGDHGKPGGQAWSPMMMRHRMMMMGHGMSPHHPPPSPAAHFRLVHRANGTAKIDIKCADNESTKACVDAAIELLNKVETMGSSHDHMGSSEDGMGSSGDSDE